MLNAWFSRKKMSILSASLLALSLAACGDQSTSTQQENNISSETNQTAVQTRTVTDALGNKVEIPDEPKRVIASYLEDYLVALGITPVAQWSVGNGASIQKYLQYALADVPIIAYDLPFEAVQSFKPDLLLMDSASMVEGDKYEQYSKMVPTFVVGKENDNNWREELTMIGEVFNKADEAQKIIEEYDQKKELAKKEIEEKVGNVSVAAIWLVGGNFYIVSDKFSSGAVLYEDLGFDIPSVVREVVESGTASWNAISLEKLAELDADYIFLINSDNTETPNTVSEELWNAIPAVKAGNVFAFSNETAWLYTGPIANSQIIDDVLESFK